MNPSSWLSLVQSQRSIAVIRSTHLNQGFQMAKAVAAGGMKLIEITWNSDQAAKLIHLLRAELPDCVIGAGTLLTLDDMRKAIAAGAQYLFTPHTNPDLIQAAVKQQIPIIPGALSPSEIVLAWQLGATCVKVFPVESLGGADYIRHLQGPLGQIPLIPTGGVTLENAKDFLQAGAVAVGLSGQLFPKSAIVSEDWAKITKQSQALMVQISAVSISTSGQTPR